MLTGKRFSERHRQPGRHGGHRRATTATMWPLTLPAYKRPHTPSPDLEWCVSIRVWRSAYRSAVVAVRVSCQDHAN